MARKKTEKEITQDLMRKAQKQMLGAKPMPEKRQTTRSRRVGTGLWHKPFASESLGVNPSQIPEATKALRAAGVMADFDTDGRLVVTSDKQYREAAKACGLWTGRDGFGGGQTDEGHRVGTGRENERRKQEFRDAVMRGDYDV